MNLRIILLLAVGLVAFSFSNQTQDSCNPYYPISKGDSWEYEEFDKKGELLSTSKTTVEDVTTDGAKVVYKLKAVSDGPKKKEKNHYENTLEYTCEDGVLKMSLDNLIPKETMEGMEGMTIDIEQSEMIIPASLKVGDKLDDASITMKASSNGMTVMTMTMTLKNRIVASTESLTTPAGTFECVVLTYDMVMNMGFVTRESSSKDWLSPKVGNVQSKSFDKNGNLTYSRVLKSYTKGG